jgi:hypothetical protein
MEKAMRNMSKILFFCCMALLIAAPMAYAQQAIEVYKDPG